MRGFAWQDGYGAFTVSKSNLPEVVHYIQNQREHHRKRTFKDEYLEFLQKHGIEPFVFLDHSRWLEEMSDESDRLNLKETSD